MEKLDKTQRFRFPRIRRVVLERFSLYTQKRKIDLVVPSGVLCLAGANGIGKSTFLAAVNFGITGIVPAVFKGFKSVSEYYDDGIRFTEDFFDGRIVEEDRETAQITVDFDIGESSFHIIRGIFEPGLLRHLSTSQGTTDKDARDTTNSEQNQKRYEELVAKAVGVKDFREYVFLQHFVFSFDEYRNLLFWNPKALEHALYLAFGNEPEVASEAEAYRREMERADSRARNFQWQATKVAGRIRVLQEALAASTNPDNDKEDELDDSYKKLVSERESAEVQVAKFDAMLADARVALAGASASLVTQRRNYEEVFARLTGIRSIVDSHPVIRTALDEKQCAICGEKGPSVAKAVKSGLSKHLCPLCNAKLHEEDSNSSDVLKTLEEADRDLSKAKSRFESCANSSERLSKRQTKATRDLNAAIEAVQQFEKEHASFVMKHPRTDERAATGVSQSITDLEAEYKELIHQKKDAYNRRNSFKRKLQKLQQGIEDSYAAAETDFVPRFRDLAELFLGIDLDIRLEPKQPVGITLILELRNTARRWQHQLSESQRFFVDIALRMALARFMSDSSSPAGLLVDTPEGSLDIAYESRAGEMFGSFVKQDHAIMMTANINSSQLLMRLAKECGTKQMSLMRMTNWTDLSEVQIQENSLFHDAFNRIEKELKGTGAES